MHSERFATDYFRSCGNNLITAIVNRTGELISDIGAQAATVMQAAIAFGPNRIQIVDAASVTTVRTSPLDGSFANVFQIIGQVRFGLVHAPEAVCIVLHLDDPIRLLRIALARASVAQSKNVPLSVISEVWGTTTADHAHLSRFNPDRPNRRGQQPNFEGIVKGILFGNRANSFIELV